WFYRAVRRIPVQYTKRQVGGTVYGGQTTHIPIKVNAAGVIPVIFATSLLYLPMIIGQFFKTVPAAVWIMNTFSLESAGGGAIEFVLIVAFTFFYTHVQMKPADMAEQLQKNSGYIPGIRSGKDTENYLVYMINRLSLIGGLFLAVVAVIPLVLVPALGLTQQPSLYFGGTSLLIIVMVSLDTVQQLRGHVLTRSYKGFIR
ncbi:MAG: SecY family transport protein, partial [Firmicutes bacterium]|nr:SecY family transport protein [Bacillota bacterium]